MDSGRRERAAGVVINPAAFTHTSVAILDALNAFAGPIIEVHISNVHKREVFRHHSYVSGVASGVIVGCGTQGYAFALQRIAKLIGARGEACGVERSSDQDHTPLGIVLGASLLMPPRGRSERRSSRVGRPRQSSAPAI